MIDKHILFILKNLVNPVPNYRLTIAAMCLIISPNTGKEVILKYMSSNHSEVAAA